jgi:hypothetical protein
VTENAARGIRRRPETEVTIDLDAPGGGVVGLGDGGLSTAEERGRHVAARPLLAAYLLGAVDGRDAELVEAHCRECPPCERALAELSDALVHLVPGDWPLVLRRIWRRLTATLAGSADSV